MNRRQFCLALFFAPVSKETVLCGVRWEVIANGSSKRRYLFIHGDEVTARQVLRAHMRTHKGVAHLVTGRDRLVDVDGGKLDPNRMFTREGAERNLRKLNPAWMEAQLSAQLDRLDHEREPLLKALTPPRGGLLVVLHNNAHGYSVRDELDVSEEKALNDASNPHEFFLVSQPADFRILAKSPFNVVLQNKPGGEEDGSLSRLMAKRGVRYVNLEVAIGKRERQVEMLEWLEKHLP